MSKKSLLTVASITTLMLFLVGGSISAQAPINITWFVGRVSDPTQQAQLDQAENQIVSDFNKSHPEIQLQLMSASLADLQAMIPAGATPDIVGPIGTDTSFEFASQWADLTPLIGNTDFDPNTSKAYDRVVLDLYRNKEGALTGIPLAVNPTVLYYNRALYDQAGLSYPPQKFGDTYKMPDGSEVPWTYDTLTTIAGLLTLNSDGKAACSADCVSKTAGGHGPIPPIPLPHYPSDIVQFGLYFQWAALPQIWTDIQPEHWYDSSSGSLMIPDSWRQATWWLWEATWQDNLIPPATAANSEQFGSGNVFLSGKLAMAVAPLWYSSYLSGSNFNWDIAVMPASLDGSKHVAADASAFHMFNTTQNPEQAFTVLSYLANEASPTLTAVYNDFPARQEYQQAWFDARGSQSSSTINWQVALDSLAYINPESTSYLSDLPNASQVSSRLNDFYTMLTSDDGLNINMNDELDKLQSDLQALVSENGKASS